MYFASIAFVLKGQTLFLGLDLLEYRRLTTDWVMLYKIVDNLVDVDRDALVTVNSSSAARNLFLKLFKPAASQ